MPLSRVNVDTNLALQYQTESRSRVEDSHDSTTTEASRHDQHFLASHSGNTVTNTDESNRSTTASTVINDNSQHIHITGSNVQAQSSAIPENGQSSRFNLGGLRQLLPSFGKKQSTAAKENVPTEPLESKAKKTVELPITLSSNMTPEMMESASNFVLRAFVDSTDNMVRAEYICVSFEKKNGESWHCAIGSNLARYQEDLYIELNMMEQRVIIFKTPAVAHVNQLKNEMKQLQDSLEIAKISLQSSDKCQELVEEYRTEIDRFCSERVRDQDLQLKHNELQRNAIEKFDEWNQMKETGTILQQRHDFITTMTNNLFSIYNVRNKERIRNENKAVWVAAKNGEFPEGAVIGGTDHEERELIIARAHHQGDLIPGKLNSFVGNCRVCLSGAEHRKYEYEVLCHFKGAWVQVRKGDTIPENALPGGRTCEGVTLFIGRVPHNGTITLGKVQPVHAKCYIPYGGKEYGYVDYEILVQVD